MVFGNVPLQSEIVNEQYRLFLFGGDHVAISGVPTLIAIYTGPLACGTLNVPGKNTVCS